MSVQDNIFYAYLAGILDGEGTIGLTLNAKNRGKYKRNIYILYVTLGMTNFEIPTLMKKTFGGSSFIRDKQPYMREYIKTRKPCMIWRVSDRKAENVVRCLFPYLRVKREHAKLALKFREETVSRKHKTRSDIIRVEEYRMKFKKLNKKGRD